MEVDTIDKFKDFLSGKLMLSLMTLFILILVIVYICMILNTPSKVDHEHMFKEPPDIESRWNEEPVIHAKSAPTDVIRMSVVETEPEPEAELGQNELPRRVSLELPPGVSGEFKTYMDYRAITYRNSIQWKLQQSAYTDEEGFRRYNGLYMVALGTYYSPEAGLEFEIELSSGRIIHCITGDIKSDSHTDSTNRYAEINGNIVEFIVDTQRINSLSKIMGDMSYSGMAGSIVNIFEAPQEEGESNETSLN